MKIEVTKSENETFDALLSTKDGPQGGLKAEQWDLLIWGNDDWFFNHPFTVFLVFRTHNVWSTITPDPIMDGYIEEMFQASVDDAEFPAICERIMRHAYDESIHAVRSHALQGLRRQQRGRL